MKERSQTSSFCYRADMHFSPPIAGFFFLCDVDTSEAARIYLQPGSHILSAGPRGMSTGPSVLVSAPRGTTQYRISEGLFLLPAE